MSQITLLHILADHEHLFWWERERFYRVFGIGVHDRSEDIYALIIYCYLARFIDGYGDVSEKSIVWEFAWNAAPAIFNRCSS